MKKVLPFAVILLVFALLSSCTGKGGNELETADTVYSVTGNAGSVSINEDTAKTMLGAFSPDILGIEKEIAEYSLKLSSTLVYGKDACLVEAYEAKADDSPVGTFAISGYDCYLYSKGTDSFLLLTATGAVTVLNTDNLTEPNGSEGDTQFEYDKANDEALKKMFSSYSPEKLGFQKSIDEYILVTTGITTTASDKKTVFVVRCYEKNGTPTNYTMAFNDNGQYKFDSEAGKYTKLK